MSGIKFDQNPRLAATGDPVDVSLSSSSVPSARAAADLHVAKETLLRIVGQDQNLAARGAEIIRAEIDRLNKAQLAA